MKKIKKKNRETVNIGFARGLLSDELISILQYELLRARSENPPSTEIHLPVSLVHDIKYRIKFYSDKYGEVERDREEDRRGYISTYEDENDE